MTAAVEAGVGIEPAGPAGNRRGWMQRCSQLNRNWSSLCLGVRENEERTEDRVTQERKKKASRKWVKHEQSVVKKKAITSTLISPGTEPSPTPTLL